jgi:hypothetical protein
MRLDVSPDGTRRLELEVGETVGFVDADWLPAAAGGVPALVVDGDGALRWGDRDLEENGDPGEAVATRLLALAEEIASVLETPGVGSVRVLGGGITAETVSRRLGVAIATVDQTPGAVVELTGDGSQLTAATEDVADGGMVLLAGEYLEPVDLNVYRDVHRRGLRVLGVTDISADRPAPARGIELPEPLAVKTGQDLMPAAWYRVSR